MAPLLDSVLDGSDPFEGTKYRSIGILGKGGMGAAHVVEHRLLGTHFVCKVLRGRHRNNRGAADRMRVEAQSLARLVHPNIVKVFDFEFTRDGRPFIVMERLEGHTLTQELRMRGELPALEAIDITRQLLSALSMAHSLGIIHRDIKLENLFLHRAGTGKPVLKVLDFGVAKIVEGTSELAPIPAQIPTRTGVVVGTPRFLSPEAAVGRAVDQRADVYSASVVLYMLLCGRGPWDDANSDAGVFSAQVHRAPPTPSNFAHQVIAPDLQAVVLIGMNKDPDERFQTAMAFDSALGKIAQQLEAERSARSVKSSSPPAAEGEPVSSQARLKLSVEQKAKTASLEMAASGANARKQFVIQAVAFAISAVASAAATWWCVSVLWHK